ncbi:hypothetical protein E2C01_071492 [Portunus trituberculatus]|uniref:Uncharacterized protein n=1 Tax=Portunus trituberculatus TaxID=210409 RepID=A0A5B7I038_PORTR|nr:hypothetical protein [Portunus trituberculatus]
MLPSFSVQRELIPNRDPIIYFFLSATIFNSTVNFEAREPFIRKASVWTWHHLFLSLPFYLCLVRLGGRAGRLGYLYKDHLRHSLLERPVGTSKVWTMMIDQDLRQRRCTGGLEASY